MAYEDALPEGFRVKKNPQQQDVIPAGFRPTQAPAPEMGGDLPEVSDVPEETGRGNIAHSMLQGLSLGWGDEALAGVLAAYGTFMPELAGGLPDNLSLQENYEGIRDTIRESGDLYAKENPAKAAVGEFGGAMLTGGSGLARAGATKLGAKPTMNILERLARNAGLGAVGGGVYGAGTAKEGERVEGAIDEAKTGALFGAAGGEVIRKLQRYFGNKTDMQQEILQKIEDGSEDINTAFYKVVRDIAEDPTPPINTNVPRLISPDGVSDVADDVAEEVIEKARPIGTPRLKKDRAQVNAARQGVGEGVLPVLREANPATKGKLLEMNRILDKSLDNQRFAQYNRVSDVAGDSALERFKFIRNKNRVAGKQLEGAAEDLKKFRVDFDPAVNDFIDDLRGLGVDVGDPASFLRKINMGNINERKAALFKGSDFEGIEGVETVLDKVLQRMKSNGKGMTAYEGHRLKRYLDTQVNFGAEGQKVKDAPQVEQVLKMLRHNIDGVLDDNFDNYRLANEDYANTVRVMNEFKRIMPNHLNLLDPSKNANSAIGTELRGVMSNRKSRVPTLNLLADLDNTAKQYGAEFDDDMLTQLMYMDELERITGSSARTGLAGEVGKALKDINESVRKPPSQAAADYFINRADSAIFGEVNDKNLVKALDELLKVD